MLFTETEAVKRFQPGKFYATLGALEQFSRIELSLCIRRHLAGDWGELSKEDWRLNNQPLIRGGRLFSAYAMQNDRKLWIITEADRSATTCLLPEDY